MILKFIDFINNLNIEERKNFEQYQVLEEYKYTR